MNLIANTADESPQLLPWITTFVVAVIGAVGAAFARKQGRQEADQRSVNLKDPVPEVPVVLKQQFATRHELCEVRSHIQRVEQQVGEIRDEQRQQFKELLQAGESRAERLGERLSAEIRGVHQRVDEFYREIKNQG